MLIAAAQLPARDVGQAETALEEATAAVGTAVAAGARLVVLPECSWPGYILGRAWTSAPWRASVPRVRDHFAQLASDAGVVLVVGLALPDTSGGVANVAVVFDVDGTVAGQAAKRFLWHFDNRWFSRGTETEVIDTAAGRLGVVVCADARMPELPRLLAAKGAQLLLDPTAWVTGGSDPHSWTNPQYEFMLRTRARENGLWTVAANKVGIEHGAVAYCGRSCIVDPAGTVVAEAPPDAPDVIIAEVEPAAAAFPVRRRPRLYAMLAQPTDRLAVRTKVTTALAPTAAALRLLVVTGGPPPAAVLDDLGAGLVIAAPGTDAGVLQGPVLVLESADRAVLVRDGEALAVWTRTHGDDAAGDDHGGVADLGDAGVSVLLGEEGLVPEMPRCAMLAGADIAVWVPPANVADAVILQEAATRAAENRMYVVIVQRTRARLCDPNGALVGDSGPRETLLVTVSLMESRLKQMAAGTDVVSDRQPHLYAALAATPEPAGLP